MKKLYEEKENVDSDKTKLIKLLTYDETIKFPPLCSIDYITQWNRKETYLINKLRIEKLTGERLDE